MLAPRAYFDAQQPMRASYVVHDDRPVNVRVELVRESDGAVVASWTPGVVQPETPQVVQWNGTAGGRVQKAGPLRLPRDGRRRRGRAARVERPERAVRRRPPSRTRPAFVFLRHQFPIRGPHGYGEYAARFGGGRGHQGQDVIAACGTPLVAARGGMVKFKQYHSAAGYYLVIDGEQTGIDYTYMHLAAAGAREQGRAREDGPADRLSSGGTGRASACHLHFEMWSAPGWYSGGSPFDPLPDLLAWDKRP